MVTADDAGLYKCQGHNVAGPVTSATTNVQIHDPGKRINVDTSDPMLDAFGSRTDPFGSGADPISLLILCFSLFLRRSTTSQGSVVSNRIGFGMKLGTNVLQI